MYEALTESPVTVIVPQSVAVFQTALFPRVPLACTNFVVPVSLMQNSVVEGLPLSFTATSIEVVVALFTVGAAGTLARVARVAVLLYAVSTLAPFRAFNWKVYEALTESPVTVFVAQVPAVCHTSEVPSVPSACTNFVVPVSLMQNSVSDGLPLAFTATSIEVAVALFTVGASGTLARVLSDDVPLYAVSTLPPFQAFTLKVYDVLTERPVTVFMPQSVVVFQTALSPRVPLA